MAALVVTPELTSIIKHCLHVCHEAAAELPGFLDGSITSTVITVCQQAMLHARHNEDMFSKVSSTVSRQVLSISKYINVKIGEL